MRTCSRLQEVARSCNAQDKTARFLTNRKKKILQGTSTSLLAAALNPKGKVLPKLDTGFWHGVGRDDNGRRWSQVAVAPSWNTQQPSPPRICARLLPKPQAWWVKTPSRRVVSRVVLLLGAHPRYGEPRGSTAPGISSERFGSGRGVEWGGSCAHPHTRPHSTLALEGDAGF